MTEALIVLGPPGVGKSVVRKRFASTHECIEMSDLIKNKMNSDSKYRAEVVEIIANGGLVPDEMINPLMEERLNKVKSFHPIMVDGSCRSKDQTVFMHDQMVRRNFEPVFLVFECPNDDSNYSKLYKLCSGRLEDRIRETREAGQKPRSEDNPVTHKNRFAEYVASIDHIIAYIAHNDQAHVDKPRDYLRSGPQKFFRDSHLYFIDASASKDEVLSQVSFHTGVTSDLSKV